jgi:hypothetical protein
MTPPKGEIAALALRSAATAAPASRSRAVHAAGRGAAGLAVRPGHGGQVRDGPACGSRGRGGRLTGHAREELSRQIWRTSHRADAGDGVPGRCAGQRIERNR